MTQEEFFERTIPEPNSGCWFWEGHCDREGYGRLGKRSAHRASYELFCAPIPDGMNILHSCDQPSCVNPDHLRPGTDQDNSDDCAKRGRRRYGTLYGEENRAAKITLEQARAIRIDSRRNTYIANDFGISRAQVIDIKRGKYWKEEIPA